jgi:hypothetical protein
MAYAVAGSLVDAWAEVAAASVREGAAVDVSDAVAATLFIDTALSSTNAMGTAPEIIIEVSSASSGDDCWHKLAPVSGPTGTPNKADFKNLEAAGQTVLDVTDPVTNNLDYDGKYVFIEDTADVTKSEIVFQTAHGADADDTVTVLDGTTNEHADTADMYTLDGAAPTSAVAFYVATLPPCCRARVLVNNRDSDSTLHTRTRIAKATM